MAPYQSRRRWGAGGKQILPFVLLDVGVDDAADVVILVVIFLEKGVVFLFLVLAFDFDILDVVLVHHRHAGPVGLGLFAGFFFFVLVLAGSDHLERGLAFNSLDDGLFDLGLFFLVVLALRFLVLGV